MGLRGMKITMTEVIMRRFNNVARLLEERRLPPCILAFAIGLFAAFLAPTHSDAQAVPPRVQDLMINRPIVRPPEPPVQKEIGELKRRVQANKMELERDRTMRYLSEISSVAVRRLGGWLSNAEKAIDRAKKQEGCKPCLDPIISALGPMRSSYLGYLSNPTPEAIEIMVASLKRLRNAMRGVRNGRFSNCPINQGRRCTSELLEPIMGIKTAVLEIEHYRNKAQEVERSR